MYQSCIVNCMYVCAIVHVCVCAIVRMYYHYVVNSAF